MIKILAFLFLSFASSNADQILDSLLEKRIKANIEITKELVDDAKTFQTKELLVPQEKKTGKAWSEFLKYVKASENKKLKELTLEMELNQELLDSYYEAEGLPAAEAAKKIAAAKKDIELLEKAKESKSK